MHQGFGIDIGGSGIKGAPVDLTTGQLAAERHRIPTPQPSRPDAVADVVAQVVRHFAWTGPVGVTFPAVVTHGVTRTPRTSTSRGSAPMPLASSPTRSGSP